MNRQQYFEDKMDELEQYRLQGRFFIAKKSLDEMYEDVLYLARAHDRYYQEMNRQANKEHSKHIHFDERNIFSNDIQKLITQ